MTRVMGHNRKSLTVEQIQRAAELYVAHDVSVRSIAERFGCSKVTVEKALHDAGIELDGRARQ